MTFVKHCVITMDDVERVSRYTSQHWQGEAAIYSTKNYFIILFIIDKNSRMAIFKNYSTDKTCITIRAFFISDLLLEQYFLQNFMNSWLTTQLSDGNIFQQNIIPNQICSQKTFSFQTHRLLCVWVIQVSYALPPMLRQCFHVLAAFFSREKVVYKRIFYE